MASLASGWVKVRQQDATDAFDRLFLAEYAKVVAIAQRVLGDAHEAEDVAQEVFCDFHRRHSPDAAYASVWLHRAAAHAALNVVRGSRRRRRREMTEALRQERLQGTAEASLDPQRAVEAAEARRDVHQALARLPARSALILALRYSGLSYAEVAAALGVGTGQVGTLLRRAEAALRKEIIRATPQ
jgi:RNA polymerase sigma-70 factor (ECF subfamily)